MYLVVADECRSVRCVVYLAQRTQRARSQTQLGAPTDTFVRKTPRPPGRHARRQRPGRRR